jgi:hypothetical protein
MLSPVGDPSQLLRKVRPENVDTKPLLLARRGSLLLSGAAFRLTQPYAREHNPHRLGTQPLSTFRLVQRPSLVLLSQSAQSKRIPSAPRTYETGGCPTKSRCHVRAPPQYLKTHEMPEPQRTLKGAVPLRRLALHFSAKNGKKNRRTP